MSPAADKDREGLNIDEEPLKDWILKAYHEKALESEEHAQLLDAVRLFLSGATSRYSSLSYYFEGDPESSLGSFALQLNEVSDGLAAALLEPIEEVVIDVDEEHSGVVVQKMSERKAEMLEMRPSGGNRLRLVFHAPTRGLIGYQGELLTDTRGTAIMNRLFKAYEPYKDEMPGRRNGVLISNDQGEAVAYAMWNLEDRGPMMIEPGWKVYQGMIVGEHNRENDLEVNVLKGKKLTNIRTTSKDEAVRLTPPIRMTLERSLAWIQDDELVEVTPKSIRLRKAVLDPNDRKRAERAKENAA